jgi:hypothetical protein
MKKGKTIMDVVTKEQINIYIKLLSEVSQDNYDFKEWIPNCIECLQFALDNEELLNEKPELYRDTLSTLSLLYSWIIDNAEWDYIVLRQKFRNIYSPKEVGTVLENFTNRLSKQKEELYISDYLVNFKDSDGKFKSVEQILNELSKKWDNL